MSDPVLDEFPRSWERTNLGEICDRTGGNIQTGPFGSQLHASDYVAIGIPSIMPVNIGDNRIKENDIKRITEADAQRLSKHRVQPGDIIYSRRGDVERHALIRDKETGWLCGTGCVKVRIGNGEVDSKFVSYYLEHPSIRQWIVQSIKRNLKVDWTEPHREDVKATVRSAIKRVLRNKEVKPDDFDQFMIFIMTQAEASYANWPVAA